jgi:peptidoglycan lytic transglycosylase G
VLIIASMIEREALVPKDRKLISAVIYNRLKQGIPIGIDATLRYRLGNWTTPLKQSELHANSAYNTRERKGLPPTPIGNPGLASIKAAANPAHVGYLYYVVKPCGNGAHAFSSTDAKFQKDVAAYNRARAKNGGKDPSHCSK